jgi:hypothetical protein
MNLYINSLVSQHTWAIMHCKQIYIKKRQNRVLTELEMKS